MRKSAFIQVLPQGDGRCSICDMVLNRAFDREAREHRRFHKRFLEARDRVGAPLPESVRESWREEGLAPQFVEGMPFSARLAAAEKWLVAEFHGHLFRVLLYDVNRLDLPTYFTKHVEERGRLSNFKDDVAAALRSRYSIHAAC